MIEITLSFAVAAFIAGVLMFLAPCTLPLVPAYLAFISGVRTEDLSDETRATAARHKIILNGTAFVLGFSVVFVVFGVAAGALGSQIGQYRSLLSQIGGVFIIMFGLLMLNLFTIAPLQKERRISLPNCIQPGHSSSAFLIGTIFALGWTPCVGPVLASVILLATDSASLVSGGLLLAIFSLGLAVPFLLTAFVYARAEKIIAQYASLSLWVSRIGGVFLLVLGFLLLTENFQFTILFGERFFDWLGGDITWIYDYL